MSNQLNHNKFFFVYTCAINMHADNVYLKENTCRNNPTAKIFTFTKIQCSLDDEWCKNPKAVIKLSFASKITH